MGREQRPGGSAGASLDRADVVIAGVAHRRHAQRQLLQAGEVVADVHVAVPQAGQQGLAAAVYHLRARRHGHRLAGADCGDHALVDDDRLVGEEAGGIRVEQPDARERDRSRGHGHQRFRQSRRLRGHRRRLRCFNLLLLAGIRVRQPGDPEGDGEKLVVRVRPDRQRRGADAGHRPQRDGLAGCAAANLEIDQPGGARPAARQQVERLVGTREHRLQEPGGPGDRPALRDVERRSGIRRLAGINGAFPARRTVGDGEGLGCVSLRGHAANGDRGRQTVGARPGRRVELEHLAAQVHALASHACAVGRDPRPRVAVFAAGGLDDEMPRLGGRLRQLRGRHLRQRDANATAIVRSREHEQSTHEPLQCDRVEQIIREADGPETSHTD